MKQDYLKPILTEMCNAVGADYDTFNFNDNDWYFKYEWTEDVETKYKLWLIDYLKKNKKVYRTICSFPSITPVEKFVDIFVNQRGWKIKK